MMINTGIEDDDHLPLSEWLNHHKGKGVSRPSEPTKEPECDFALRGVRDGEGGTDTSGPGAEAEEEGRCLHLSVHLQWITICS